MRGKRLFEYLNFLEMAPPLPQKVHQPRTRVIETSNLPKKAPVSPPSAQREKHYCCVTLRDAA